MPVPNLRASQIRSCTRRRERADPGASGICQEEKVSSGNTEINPRNFGILSSTNCVYSKKCCRGMDDIPYEISFIAYIS